MQHFEILDFGAVQTVWKSCRRWPSWKMLQSDYVLANSASIQPRTSLDKVAVWLGLASPDLRSFLHQVYCTRLVSPIFACAFEDHANGTGVLGPLVLLHDNCRAWRAPELHSVRRVEQLLAPPVARGHLVRKLSKWAQGSLQLGNATSPERWAPPGGRGSEKWFFDIYHSFIPQ